MNRRWRSMLLAGLMTVSLCACQDRTAEEETQVPSLEPTQASTENTEGADVFHAFLRGESEAVVDEDFYDEVYDDKLTDMEWFTITELFDTLKEIDMDAGDGILSYAVEKTLGGREMLTLFYTSDGAMGPNLYLVFGDFDGQVRLTYATEFGYRSDVELYQGLIFFGAGSAGAGHHYAWGGYINEDGHYQKVYEMEILNGQWIVMDARDAFDMKDADWDWDWANNCVCYLLTTDEGRFYDLDAIVDTDLADVDPEKLALLRQYLEKQGLTEIDDAEEIIDKAESAHGIQEVLAMTDWTPLELLK